VRQSWDVGVESYTVRSGTLADLPRIVEIYNHYVVHTPITFDVEPVSVEQRRGWFSEHSASGRYRLLVAEASGAVVGYAGTHRFRPRAAYDCTVETTVYCDPNWTRRGVGTALYRALFDAIRDEDITSYIAGVTLPNDASVELHARFGFQHVGTMRRVGRKFGTYWDVGWYQAPHDAKTR
jgi:phosphinothricin acetyltransferase